MPKKKSKGPQYFEAIGRRKSATARVRLYLLPRSKKIIIENKELGVGDIYVNNVPVENYFKLKSHKAIYNKPFALVDSVDRFAVSIHVNGGGNEGQLDAVVLGIARALLKIDESYKSTLKKEGFLTRDPRVRERRKAGTGGKARRQKQSPKR